MQIKGPIKIITDKSGTAYHKLQEMILLEGKKIKLNPPFLANGFKSEKTPIQPDGITLVKIENIGKSEIELPNIESPKPVEAKKYTEQDLLKMNKKQQTDIFKSLGIQKIPLLEKDRIKKILEIQ